MMISSAEEFDLLDVIDFTFLDGARDSDSFSSLLLSPLPYTHRRLFSSFILHNISRTEWETRETFNAYALDINDHMIEKKTSFYNAKAAAKCNTPLRLSSFASSNAHTHPWITTFASMNDIKEETQLKQEVIRSREIFFSFILIGSAFPRWIDTWHY